MKALNDTTALERTRPVSMASAAGVLSLPQLLEHHRTPSPSLIEPGLLPSSGILFLGGQPKIGKSILAVNLALALASGSSLAGFDVPTVRRVLICQFELPTHHFAHRLDIMRRPIGSAADSHVFVDTGASGHLLSTSAGLDHFLDAARSVAAEVIVLDPLYSTHDQDENDTRAMTALCQSLLHLRDASGAALIVIHHVRKSIGRHEIGTAFRGSSALHAVGDSYLLLTPVSSPFHTVEVSFQLRYAAAPPPRRLSLDPETLWFQDCPSTPAAVPTRRKVESCDVQRVLTDSGPARFNQLRQRIMDQSSCSRRTAQLAIQRACQQGSIVCTDGLYRLLS
jgi:hypothetical protein